MNKYQLVSLLWLIMTLNGQTLVDLRTQTKNVDFSSAASTIPAKSGTVLPATCGTGEMFFKTDNTPGQNVYGCAPANTWTLLSAAASSSGTVSAATGGQFGFYSATGNTIVGHTLVAGDIPALSYQAPLTFTGNGARTASSTGSLGANNCAKWDANGNIVDAGAPCGSSSGGGGPATPANTTIGNIPQYSNTTGSALSVGLGVVATVGSPGSDSNVPTEKSVRTAIAAAASAAGNLPPQTGVAGYLVTNGTTASWGNIVTGPSGALDCVTTAGVCDVVGAVVPLKATANLMTGVNKFSQLQVLVVPVASLPACNSSIEGQMAGVSDAVSASYNSAVTGGGSVHIPVYCNGTAWVAH